MVSMESSCLTLLTCSVVSAMVRNFSPSSVSSCSATLSPNVFDSKVGESEPSIVEVVLSRSVVTVVTGDWAD
uniref:Putative secreted protein n=1 Tax=Anopheles marajoara TaxID=58244 RepID=A0A2M4CDZ8_9DIPT